MNKKRGIIFAVLFAFITVAASFLKIELFFGIITLETLMILLSGAMLGPRYGALAMIIYVPLKITGVYFTVTGAYFSPTVAFFLSYPVAAFFIGKLIRVKKLKTFRMYFSLIIMLIFISLLSFRMIQSLALLFMFTGNYFIFIIVPVLFTLLLIYLIYMFKKDSLDKLFAMSIGVLIIYIGYIMRFVLATHLGGWESLKYLLPYIMGDVIQLLFAAWIAGRIDISKYLIPSQRGIAPEVINSQSTETPTTQPTTTPKQ